MINDKKVVVESNNNSFYPTTPPFDPDKNILELDFISNQSSDNTIYTMVRNILLNLSLDSKNKGSSNWNPFSDLVKEGGTVFIKPNLAKHEHRLGDAGLISTITHGSVLRPLIDYAYKAVGSKGKIIVGDTPFEMTEWQPMMDITGIEDMVNALKQRGYPIRLIDLRKYETVFLPGFRDVETIEKNGDPIGYVTVDLKNKSEFYELDKAKQNYHTLADHSVDHYDPFTEDIGITNKHHYSGKHEYLISKSILSSDLIINVPKLKTHGKTGVTLNLKNMIGIVSGKEYMPHHRPGAPPRGDAFPDAPDSNFINHRMKRRDIAERFSWIRKIFPKFLSNMIENLGRSLIFEPFMPLEKYMDDRIEWGDWHGNNTLWRTVLDLNKIVLYASKTGDMCDNAQRNYFSIIDGIWGQEGQGPTNGDPIQSKVLIGGFNPVSVDTIACYVMGINPNNINIMSKTKHISHYLIGTPDISSIQVICNGEFPRYNFNAPGNSPRAWKRKIELNDSSKFNIMNIAKPS